MSRLKQPPNDLPAAPQGERASNLLGRYYTLPSPPQETRELKTVNSGTIQGKITEIQSKEEKKKKQKEEQRKSSPRTYNLKAAVACSRLPRETQQCQKDRRKNVKFSKLPPHCDPKQEMITRRICKLQIELDFSGTVYDERLLVVSFARERAALSTASFAKTPT